MSTEIVNVMEESWKLSPREFRDLFRKRGVALLRERDVGDCQVLIDAQAKRLAEKVLAVLGDMPKLTVEEFKAKYNVNPGWPMDLMFRKLFEARGVL